MRVYFKYNPALLAKLCRAAYESLSEYITTLLSKSAGELGVVMASQQTKWLLWAPNGLTINDDP